MYISTKQFVLLNIKFSSFPFDDISLLYHTRTYVNVFILPEIILPDPQHGETMNSCTKFRKNPKMSKKIRRFETGSLAWPSFVYDQYDVDRAIAKIIDSLPATIDASKNKVGVYINYKLSYMCIYCRHRTKGFNNVIILVRKKYFTRC